MSTAIRPKLGRFFAKLIATLVAVAFFYTGSARAELPDYDPGRVWAGDAFAETTLAWLKKEHPEIQVESGIKGFNLGGLGMPGGMPVPRVRPGRFLPAGFPQFFNSVEALELLGKLSNGHPVKLASSDTRPIEAAIKAWLEKSADNSVAPHELLGFSVVQAKGNMLTALSALWNVLVPDWRAAPVRNSNAIISKLIDVTGEAEKHEGAGHFVIQDASPGSTKIEKRIAFVVTKRGDKFSTYYHYFGTTLMSQYLAAKYKSPELARGFTKWAAKYEASLYEETSGLAGEREKRIGNDVQGALAGARLQELIESPELVEVDRKISAESYLRNSHMAGKHALESDGRPPAYFNSKVDSKFWEGPMSVEELKLRFEYATKVNDQIFDPVILASGRDGERLQLGLSKYLDAGAADPDLNHLIADFQSGIRGKKHITSFDFDLEPERNKRHINSQFDYYEINGIKDRVDRLMNVIVDKTETKVPCQTFFQRLSRKGLGLFH